MESNEDFMSHETMLNEEVDEIREKAKNIGLSFHGYTNHQGTWRLSGEFVDGKNKFIDWNTQAVGIPINESPTSDGDVMGYIGYFLNKDRILKTSWEEFIGSDLVNSIIELSKKAKLISN